MVQDDFTTWTESDAAGRISKSASRVTWTNLNRTDTNTYIYKDKTGTLQNFTRYFTLKITAISSATQTIRGGVIFVSEFLDDYSDVRAGLYESFGIMIRSVSSTTTYSLIIWETYNGTGYTVDTANNLLNVGTTYYCKIVKSGTSFKLFVYTDSAFSIEEPDYIGGRTLALHGNWNLQYMMIAQSINLATSVTISGYLENLKDSLISDGTPRNLKAKFVVRKAGSQDLKAEAFIASTGTADLDAKFIVRKSGSADLHAEFVIGQGVSDLSAEFMMRQSGGNDLKSILKVSQSASFNLLAKLVVRQSGSTDLKAVFAPRRPDSEDLLTVFEVGQNVLSLPARFYLMRGVDIVFPVSVTTSDYEAAIRYPIAELSFFAANRHWIFYATSGKMRYRTSPDGRVWSATTEIGSISVSGNMATHFDGEYLHVARIQINTMYYRRGRPNTDGSITWSAAEQAVVVTGDVNQILHPSIAVLAGGYPAISYTSSDGISWKPRVKISDNNDGTWSGSEVEFALNNASAVNWGSKLLTFGSGLYVLYARDLYTIRAREYNGSWQGEEDTGYDARIGVTWSATLRNGEIHIAFVEDASRDIYHGYRSVGGVWEAGVPVMVGTYTNHGVQILASAEALYVFYLDMNDNAIVYRKSIDNGSTWLDETGNDTFQKFVDSPAPIHYSYDIQAYEVKTGGHIGIMWLTGATPPYTIYFADIGPLTATGLNLLSKFIVRHAGAKDLSATFHVGQDSRGLKGLIRVTRPGYAQLSVITIIRHSASSGLAAEMVVRHPASRPLKALFIVRQSATRDLGATIIIRHSSSKILFSEFGITHFEDLSAEAVIRHSVFSELKSEFKVRQLASQELKGTLLPRRSASSEFSASFELAQWMRLKAAFIVRHETSTTLPASFEVGQDSQALKAVFRLRQEIEDLLAEFLVWPASNLKAEFIVRHSKFVRRRIYAKFVIRRTASPLELPAAFTVARSDSQVLLAIFSTSTVNAEPIVLPSYLYVRPKYLIGESSKIDGRARRTEIKGEAIVSTIKKTSRAEMKGKETETGIRKPARARMRS